MALNLSELKFVVDDSDLKRASDTIGNLVTSVGKLDKAARTAAQTEAILARAAKDSAKANLDNAKAQDTRLKSTITADKADQQAAAAIERKTKATERASTAIKKNADMLQLQNDTYDFILEGFSKGDAKVLAMAKATGQLSDQLKQVLTDIRQFSKNTFDQTETGLDRMVKSAKEASSAQGFLNNGLNLTSKQAKELSNDLDRLNIRLQHQGKSYQEITKEQAIYKQRFVEEANAVNRATSALAAVEKQRKDVVSATNYLTQAEAKMAAALNTSNAALDKAGTDSLVKYETALRKSGVSQDVATAKLAKYKAQLEQVQIQEQKRREEHLTRALAPQATDIVVSLWSGQNPLTVLLQQGGQVTDLFMQSGVAAEKFGEVVKSSMKSMLPSILNVVKGVGGLLVDGFVDAGNAVSSFLAKSVGMTGALDELYMKMSKNGPSKWGGMIRDLSSRISGTFAGGIAAGVTVLVALGTAAYQTMKEQDKLAQSLALYNGTLAVSHKSSLEYVAALNDVGVTTGNASTAITQMAKAGVFASEDIMLVAKAAANLADYSDVAVEDTIKSFAKLKEKPVEALLEIAKQTGMVSIETIKMVEELQKAGKQSEASAAAMQAYADVTTNQVDRIKETYSSFGLFVMELGKKIKNFFSQVFKDIFYVSTESLRRDIARLEEMTEGYNNVPGYDPRRHELQVLKDKLAIMELESAAFEEQIKNNTEAAKVEEFGIKLREEANKVIDKSVAKTLNLTEYTKQYVKEKTKGQKVEADTLKLIEKAAEVEWKAMQKKDRGGSSASSSLDIERTNEVSILEREFTRENKLREKVLKDRLSMEKTAYELGRTTKAEYMRNELDILRETLNAEEKTTSETLAKREQLYLQDTSAAIAAYQKRVAANAGLKNADKQNADALTNLQTELGNSARAYEDFIEKAKASGEALKSSISAKEFEVYRKLVENIKETTKAVEEYNFANANRIREQAQEYSDRKALRWATPEQAAVIKAVAEATKFYASELAKLQKVAEKAKAVYDNQAYFFGSDSPQAQEALRNYESALGNVNQAVADARVAKEKAATDAITDYYDEEFKQIYAGLKDSIVTALFEGGKSGSKKFRDLVVAELKKPVTMVVNAVVNTVLGNIVGSLMGGAAAGAAGGAAGGVAGSIGSSIAGSAIMSGIGMMGTEGLANIAGFLGGDALGVLGAGASGGFSSAIASAIGQIPVWGWIAGGLFAVASMFDDDSGTYHTGGAARYSKGEGLTSGNSGAAFDIGFGQVETGKETISAMEQLSKSLVEIFDGIAKTFGKTAGYEVAVAFADDTSDDGAWGAFAVRLQGVEILNWEDFRQSKWAPKEFGDGEEGYKQYLAAIAKDTRQVILDMDLPSWADQVLNEIGDAPSLESLSKAIQELAQMKSMYDLMTSQMVNFAGITDEAFGKLIKEFGDIGTMTNQVTGYYQNYYSEFERFNKAQADVTKSFTDLGLTMPTSREEFRKLAESQDLNTEAGRKMYAQLMALAASFGVVIDATEQLANARTDIVYRMMEQEAQLLDAQGRTVEADKKRRELLDKQRGAEYERLMKVNPELARLTAELWALEDAAVAAAKVKEIADIRQDLTDRILQQEAELLDSQGRTAEADRKRRELLDRQRARENERLMALNPELARLAYELWLLEDATAAAAEAAALRTKKINESYSQLQKAVEAEKKVLNERIATSQELINTLTTIFDTVSEAVKELYNQVDSTAAMSFQSAKSYISGVFNSVIQGGGIGDSKLLTTAVEDAMAGLSANNYRTKADYDRERLRLAGQLALIGDSAGESLTNEQKVLKGLKDQVDKLDETLAYWKDMIDIANGTYVATVSVTQAVNQLTELIRTVTSPDGKGEKPMPKPVGTEKPSGGGTGNRPVFGGGGGGGSGGVTYDSNGNIVYPDGSIGYRNWYRDVAGILRWGSVSKSTWEEEYAKGTVGYGNPPAFAKGGNYLGGLALVGEEGPELINFNQGGYVHTASQTASMLSGNSGLEARIANLERAAVSTANALTQIANNTKRTADTLRNISPNGDSIQVESESFLEL